MDASIPRLVIAGLSGDAGKTTVCLSLAAALRRRGLRVSAFKKGPDYIDSAWLGEAAQTVCHNLDTYLVEAQDVLADFIRVACNSDVAIIEGNRGIFDGKDLSGTHSTAELAKLLKAPVVLCVSAAKTTRTVAALVQGCKAFDPQVEIRGVILNRVAGSRHREIVAESIRQYCNLPVYGTIPKYEDVIPVRHLGLIPPAEFPKQIGGSLEKIAQNLDIDGLLRIAQGSEKLAIDTPNATAEILPRVRIGYFRDSAFTFYYPENLDSLQGEGAELVAISSLECESLPDIDALYIGGGFPETHAGRLAQNRALATSVKEAAQKGLPIYAECGGLIYLCRSLDWNGNSYPMAGVFAEDLAMRVKPVGHGYTLVKIDRANPFFEVGTTIRGHEFHYSGIADLSGESCMQVLSGVGLGKGRDGLLFQNTLATYSHIHAHGVKSWAPAVVANAMKYKSQTQAEACYII